MISKLKYIKALNAYNPQTGKVQICSSALLSSLFDCHIPLPSSCCKKQKLSKSIFPGPVLHLQHKLDKKTLQTNFFEQRIFERECEGLLALGPSPQASKKTRGDDVSPIRL